MNTKQWGPHAWTFDHGLTAYYPDNPSQRMKQLYKCFFMKTGDVLPCKYCRASYAGFVKIPRLNIDKFLGNKRDLMFWFYGVHNCVNDKLRKQGFNDKPDPNFEEVYIRYTQNVTFWQIINAMWDFLYTVAFNYPIKGEEYCRRNITEYLRLLSLILPNEYQYNDIFNYHLDWETLNWSLISRENFKSWMNAFDRAVSMDVYYKWGVHRMIPSPRDLEVIYEGRRANCNKGTCSITKDNMTQACSIVVPHNT